MASLRESIRKELVTITDQANRFDSQTINKLIRFGRYLLMVIIPLELASVIACMSVITAKV